MARKRATKRNPGAKSCICTAPHKFAQWRYKIGFALVRSQHYENAGTSKRPKWIYVDSHQMPKGTANKQIANLRELGWKIKVTY